MLLVWESSFFITSKIRSPLSLSITWDTLKWTILISLQKISRIFSPQNFANPYNESLLIDGLISEIIQPEQEEVVDEEVEEEVVEASAFATKESVNDLKATLEEMKSLLTEREKVIDGLIESFSKFSKEPNGKAAKKETKFSSDFKSGTMSQEDKMKFFSDRKRK